jgi:protein SCO1/2
MLKWMDCQFIFCVFSCLFVATISSNVARSQIVTDSGGPVSELVGITPKLGVQVPLDLKFADSSGRELRLGECFAGRPVVLHLVYYECPMLCKLSADGLFDTLATLSLAPGEDFSIVTLSFDPRETPELSARARQIAIERCGAKAVERGWRFLTGKNAEISALTEAVGFRYLFDEKTKQYAHAAGVFVLTPEGIVSRYLSGINYSPRDLRLAIVEAGGGKVGTASDQALLLCYMYDPVRGRYGLAIMTILRAAGVATVGIMATAIVVMLRREGRNGPAG